MRQPDVPPDPKDMSRFEGLQYSASEMKIDSCPFPAGACRNPTPQAQLFVQSLEPTAPALALPSPSATIPQIAHFTPASQALPHGIGAVEAKIPEGIVGHVRASVPQPLAAWIPSVASVTLPSLQAVQTPLECTPDWMAASCVDDEGLRDVYRGRIEQLRRAQAQDLPRFTQYQRQINALDDLIRKIQNKPSSVLGISSIRRPDGGFSYALLTGNLQSESKYKSGFRFRLIEGQSCSHASLCIWRQVYTHESTWTQTLTGFPIEDSRKRPGTKDWPEESDYLSAVASEIQDEHFYPVTGMRWARREAGFRVQITRTTDPTFRSPLMCLDYSFKWQNFLGTDFPKNKDAAYWAKETERAFLYLEIDPPKRGATNCYIAPP